MAVHVISSIYTYYENEGRTHDTNKFVVSASDDGEFANAVRALVEAKVRFIADDVELPRGKLRREAEKVIYQCVMHADDGLTPPDGGKIDESTAILFVSYAYREEDLEDIEKFSFSDVE